MRSGYAVMEQGGMAGALAWIRNRMRDTNGLTVAAASLLAVPALVLMSNSEAVESAIAAAMADPAAILAARSPGARAPGALTQTKPYYTHPTERVLGQDRTRPPGDTPTDSVSPLAATDPAVVPDAFAQAAGVAPATTDAIGTPGLVPVGGAPVVGVGGGGGGGGGSGGGGGGGGGTDPGTPPITVVPEPSTWMMTILGFFAAGLGLRARYRRRRLAVERAAALN